MKKKFKANIAAQTRTTTTTAFRHYGQKEVRPMQIYIYLSSTATITRLGKGGMVVRGTHNKLFLLLTYVYTAMKR